jgi:hypothetical protein
MGCGLSTGLQRPAHVRRIGVFGLELCHADQGLLSA